MMSSGLRLSSRMLLAFPILFVGLSLLPLAGVMAEDQTTTTTQLISPSTGPVVQTKRSSDGVWEDVGAEQLNSLTEREIVPKNYRTIRLNMAVLQKLLRGAPTEFTDAAQSNEIVVRIPFPDGSFSRFRIEESPIMEAQLAARFPEIKTYRGQGIDDPTATVRFDVTPTGFHAQVLSNANTVFVDPYAKGETAVYLSYFKHDFQKNSSTRCLAGLTVESMGVNISEAEITLPQVVTPNGQTLRNYRLALAATGEYTLAAGGTVPLAMSRMSTSLNRINGIYERELALRMTLIASNDSLIYTNPSTDPYTNSDVSAMMLENQTNLDNVIGNTNYDMGHVFGTGNGGTAPVRSTCNATFKGRGVTGLPNPVGDPFDVDFAAHEMGHQHGGLHTFNTIAGGSCAPGFRNPISAFEPGSGSTPMSYVGTCAPANLQPNAHDYFHVRSLEEMVTHMNGAGNCAAQSPTGNSPPTVNAGPDFNIPRNTPFALTATGSDLNGDTLTYAWEEYDLGPNPGGSSPPENDADGVARPIFRSFRPSASPTRTFPSLQYILNNANVPPATYDCGLPTPCITGESLPNITRTMNFQATARDNRSTGGGVVSDLMQVNVNAGTGPFIVTQPNTAVSWGAGTSQTVLWDVAGTSSAPINVTNVNILLSTDGGMTFPTVLAAATANDGTQSVTVPNLPTGTARIKVEAVGNIFFDISGSNFTISAPGPPPTVQFSAASSLTSEGAATVSISVSRSGDTTGASTVDFATGDTAGTTNCNVVNGTASARCDYLNAAGTLSFAAGETSKNITVSVINDSFAEGNETFTVTLSNPSSATLGSPGTTVVTITDNETVNGTNPIDLSSFFVRQHYLDFLNREPDAAGLSFWIGEIDNCTPKPACTDPRRVNVSAAFFLSIEFQQTGYLVQRLYKSAYGDRTATSTFGGTHQLAVPVMRLNEFLLDARTIGSGVVVNQSGWEQVLANNKQAFVTAFVQRPRFTTEYPLSLTAAQFVDKLNLNAGNPLSTSERNQLVNDLTTGLKSRAQVLRAVAEDSDLNSAEFNRAFVLFQYFGYLRRNPDDGPDSDYTGYDFWLSKLNQFGGNFVNAEMVKAFIVSSEYRQRFGP